MADGGVGFMGRCEIVEPRRRNRRWPAEEVGSSETFAPAAYSCKIPTICSSVKRDLRIVCSPCPVERYKNKISF